ncbi:MAG: hypothetical protein EOM70_08015, partial [Clostridia bacterium]|nr:hypothetical protein [Clostridia bacterium]
MDHREWDQANQHDAKGDPQSPDTVEFFNIQPRHVPNPGAPDLDDDFADDPVRHPRQFREYRLQHRKPVLSKPVVFSVLLLVILVAAALLIQRLIAGDRETSPETTPTTVIQVTTTTASAPVQILTIKEGQRYNIRPFPGVGEAALKTATGGEQYTILSIMTGEQTLYGDQWYEIMLDGNAAYIIVDTEGQDVTERES